MLPRGPLFGDVAKAYEQHSLGYPEELGETIAPVRFEEFRSSTRLPRRVWRSADAHVCYLATVSTYLKLPRPQAQDLPGRIRAALPDEVEVDAALTVQLARTVGGGD